MKPAAVNLDDLGPETLEAARVAAERSGLSLGHWLQRAVMKTAADVARRARQPPGLQESSERAAERKRLDRLAVELEAGLRSDGGSARPVEDIGPSLRAIESHLAAIAHEIVPSTTASVAPLTQAMVCRNSQLEKLLPGRLAAGAPGPNASAPAAGANQAGHAEPQHAVASKPGEAAPDSPANSESWSQLDRQLRSITREMALLTPASQSADEARRRGGDGAALAEQIPPNMLDPLAGELRIVAARVASLEAGSAGIADALGELRGDLQRVASGQELANTEVKSLASQAERLAAAGAALSELENAIGELRGLAGRLASSEAVAALAETLGALDAKLEGLTAASDLAGRVEDLTRRVAALAGLLEQQTAREGVLAPELQSLIEGLADKLEAARCWSESPCGFEALEQRLIAVADKLEATDQRLTQLSAIDEGLDELLAQLENTRSAAMESAEYAARMVAGECMAARSQAAEEVEALRSEVCELRSAQDHMDRRTDTTLEAVKSTLEQLVERLALIPSDDSAAAAATHPAVEPGEVAVAAAALAPAPEAHASLPRELRAHEPRLAMPEDVGEPGSALPPWRPLPSPAERIAASQAALGRTPSPAEGRPADKANFIAAARRAAQAAAETAGAGDRAKPTQHPLGAMKEMLGKRPGPLLAGLALFALALGSVELLAGLTGTLRGRQPTVPAAASAPTAPARSLTSEQAKTLLNAPAGRANRSPAGRTAEQAANNAPSLGPPLLFEGQGLAQASSKPEGGEEATGWKERVVQPTSFSDAGSAEAVTGVTASAEKLPASIGGPHLRAAALADDPSAAYEIALRFSEGRGVAQSFEEAARWFERAANHGLAPAQYRLGSLYEKGQGVKKDLDAARKLYLAAAEHGSGKAMHNLAVLFAEGTAGKLDYKTASAWFRKAAAHGIRDSQYNLGILYARGIGVEQNLLESYKWFALAAQQGDEDAAKKRDEVAQRLDPQSLVSAKLAVETFRTEAEPEEAVSVKSPSGGWDQSQVGKPRSSARRIGAT